MKFYIKKIVEHYRNHYSTKMYWAVFAQSNLTGHLSFQAYMDYKTCKQMAADVKTRPDTFRRNVVGRLGYIVFQFRLQEPLLHILYTTMKFYIKPVTRKSRHYSDISNRWGVFYEDELGELYIRTYLSYRDARRVLANRDIDFLKQYTWSEWSTSSGRNSFIYSLGHTK